MPGFGGGSSAESGFESRSVPGSLCASWTIHVIDFVVHGEYGSSGYLHWEFPRCVRIDVAFRGTQPPYDCYHERASDPSSGFGVIIENEFGR